MGVYGTNLEGFGAFEGGVNADKGAPLVSTSSDGETALLFGPAALREIQAGVANGDFAIPPDDGSATITDDNPLPYWTFTDTSSAGAITCALALDVLSASSNVLRWTVAAGTTTGKSASISRYIAVPSSRDKAYAFWPEVYVRTEVASRVSNRQLTMTLQFFNSNLASASTAITRSFTFSSLDADAAVFLNADTPLRLVVPADASFAKLTIAIETTGTNASAVSLDMCEVKFLAAPPILLLADRSGTNGPSAIWQNTAELVLSASIPTTASGGLLNTTNPYMKVTATTVQLSAPTVIVEGDLQVTGNAVLEGANSNWVSRITATAAQSLTNNTLTKITFNTASSTPGLDSYDPQGWFDNVNDRIVIGQDGFYNITANVGFAANATSRRLVQIFVNGSDRGSVQVTASAAGSTLLSVSTNIYLVATDYVEVHALQQSGGALNTASVTGVYPVLSVSRLGA